MRYTTKVSLKLFSLLTHIATRNPEYNLTTDYTDVASYVTTYSTESSVHSMIQSTTDSCYNRESQEISKGGNVYLQSPNEARSVGP